MRVWSVVLAAMLVLTPLAARAADLVVWWEKGFSVEEDAAIREVVVAFEQKTGKTVELESWPLDDLRNRVLEALDAGHPPDFLFSLRASGGWQARWAREGRLVELSTEIEPFTSLFAAETIEPMHMLDDTGKIGIYALPIGRGSNYVHVWRSLLEPAGLGLSDIPKAWSAFWLFWCDKVQPAVRKATGREDIWGTGLSMSIEASDTIIQWYQFLRANDAAENYWFNEDGTLDLDSTDLRLRLIETLAEYTSIYSKGYTPPEAVDWKDSGNNQAFLDQKVIMTPNMTLTIPNALKDKRPDDYRRNAATVDWPITGSAGQQLLINGTIYSGVVFKTYRDDRLGKEFVHFLLADGWLAHYLSLSRERYLSPMPKLLDQPFWLDPNDPHRLMSARQLLTRRSMPLIWDAPASRWAALFRMDDEQVWTKAIHRVAAEGVSPEQAVDEAIARVKQLLSE